MKLETIIELARKHHITAEEHDAQVRSFVYGNTHFEDEAITREDVDKAVEQLNIETSPGAGKLGGH